MDAWSEHEGERRRREARRDIISRLMIALFLFITRIVIIVLVIYAVLKLVGVL
jgi:ribosomal protein S6E (S10)